jgi:serine protease AprX
MRLLIVCVLFSVSLRAQQLYWVTFTQKDSIFSTQQPLRFLTEASVMRRLKWNIPITFSDLPVSAVYLNQLTSDGFVLITQSKWLNGAVVLVQHKEDLAKLKAYSFILSQTFLGTYQEPRTSGKRMGDINEMLRVLSTKNDSRNTMDTNWYGKSYRQVSMLHTQQLHHLGFKGEGVKIALLDAGFNNADTLPVFQQLRLDKRIKATYDFVQHNEQVYDDDDHGLAVLSCMAGYQPHEFVGTAPMADYYLLRSEYAKTEMPIEELYWIAAIEYADSIGVDIVNSSLGYNQYDDIRFSYTHKDLDGKTSLISKAATMAVQKGLVVLVSAGNEGDDDWKFISVPADVKEVITVGGVDPSGNLVGFSSIGPTADKRIKPDVMAMADNVWVASSRGVYYPGDGTSYSCPLMTGSVACLMQAYPLATPARLQEVLHLASSNYNEPDKYIGYGIPDLKLAYDMLKPDTAETIIDVRVLNDGKVHMVFRSVLPQKVICTLQNEQGETILTETIQVKKAGVSRISLKKIKQFSKGNYSLQCQFKQGKVIFPFTYAQ